MLSYIFHAVKPQVPAEGEAETWWTRLLSWKGKAAGTALSEGWF